MTVLSPIPIAPQFPGQTNDAWSPKLGVNYKFDDVYSIYGNVSKAFRNPTITELYADGTIFPGNNLVPNPNLRPETAINKEIGLRFKNKNWIMGGDRITSRLSVFQNDVDDYIEQVVGVATTQFRNASEARLRGIEFESEYETTNYLANFSAGFVRGENLTANQPLVDVPPAKASLSIARKLTDQDMLIGWRTEMAAAQDRIPSGQPQIVRTGGYAIHGVYMTWEPSDAKYNDMRIDFGVDNLFDKYYRRQLAFIPEEGRDIKLRVSFKF